MDTTKQHLPRRRVVIEIKIGADDRERMIDELDGLLRDLRSGHLWGECLSAGYGSGYTLSATEDLAVTHDSYFAALEDFVGASAKGGS